MVKIKNSADLKFGRLVYQNLNKLNYYLNLLTFKSDLQLSFEVVENSKLFCAFSGSRQPFTFCRSAYALSVWFSLYHSIAMCQNHKCIQKCIHKRNRDLVGSKFGVGIVRKSEKRGSLCKIFIFQYNSILKCVTMHVIMYIITIQMILICSTVMVYHLCIVTILYVANVLIIKYLLQKLITESEQKTEGNIKLY